MFREEPAQPTQPWLSAREGFDYDELFAFSATDARPGVLPAYLNAGMELGEVRGGGESFEERHGQCVRTKDSGVE